MTHLEWIYDRMVNVHGEDEKTDYMIKFKEEIEIMDSLWEDSEWLACLEMVGVDNWVGYDMACDIKNGK